MPLRSRDTFKITLDDFDAPELYVVFRDPWSLSVAEHRVVRDANVVLMRIRRDNNLPDDADLWAFTAIDNLMTRNLVEWNLTDADGKVLPTDVVNPFDPLPADVFRHVADTFQERLLQPPKSGRG